MKVHQKSQKVTAKETVNIVELEDKIEELLLNKPNKRSKTDYNTWLININNLINTCNDEANFKIYGNVK